MGPASGPLLKKGEKSCRRTACSRPDDGAGALRTPAGLALATLDDYASHRELASLALSGGKTPPPARVVRSLGHVARSIQPARPCAGIFFSALFSNPGPSHAHFPRFASSCLSCFRRTDVRYVALNGRLGTSLVCVHRAERLR